MYIHTVHLKFLYETATVGGKDSAVIWHQNGDWSDI